MHQKPSFEHNFAAPTLLPLIGCLSWLSTSAWNRQLCVSGDMSVDWVLEALLSAFFASIPSKLVAVADFLPGCLNFQVGCSLSLLY